MNGEEIREEFDELVRDYELQDITVSEQRLKGFFELWPLPNNEDSRRHTGKCSSRGPDEQ